MEGSIYAKSLPSITTLQCYACIFLSASRALGSLRALKKFSRCLNRYQRMLMQLQEDPCLTLSRKKRHLHDVYYRLAYELRLEAEAASASRFTVVNAAPGICLSIDISYPVNSISIIATPISHLLEKRSVCRDADCRCIITCARHAISRIPRRANPFALTLFMPSSKDSLPYSHTSWG